MKLTSASTWPPIVEHVTLSFKPKYTRLIAFSVGLSSMKTIPSRIITLTININILNISKRCRRTASWPLPTPHWWTNLPIVRTCSSSPCYNASIVLHATEKTFWPIAHWVKIIDIMSKIQPPISIFFTLHYQLFN
jgi:hypothetical protein